MPHSERVRHLHFSAQQGSKSKPDENPKASARSFWLAQLGQVVLSAFSEQRELKHLELDAEPTTEALSR